MQTKHFEDQDRVNNKHERRIRDKRDELVAFYKIEDLKDEIARVVGEYVLDVRDFRSGNKNKILADIYEMTRKRFQLARYRRSHRRISRDLLWSRSRTSRPVN